MPTQSNGEYAASLLTDDPDRVETYTQTRVFHENEFEEELVEETKRYQADSLRQLKYWADHLFTANGLGEKAPREPAKR
jgi:hypothetical protein